MATDTDAAASATSPAPTSANNEAPKDSSAPPPRMTPMPDTGEVELLCSQCNNLVPLRIAPPTPLPGDRIYRFFCVTCYPDQSTRQRLTTAAAATAAALAVGWRLTGDGVPPCRQRSHAPESTVSDRYVRKVLNDSGEPTGDEIFLHLLPRSWADATHVAAYNMHILSGRQQTYVDLPATTITRAGRVSRCCQPNHPSRCSLALTSSNATQRSRSPNSLPTHSLSLIVVARSLQLISLEERPDRVHRPALGSFVSRASTCPSASAYRDIAHSPRGSCLRLAAIIVQERVPSWRNSILASLNNHRCAAFSSRPPASDRKNNGYWSLLFTDAPYLFNKATIKKADDEAQPASDCTQGSASPDRDDKKKKKRKRQAELVGMPAVCGSVGYTREHPRVHIVLVALLLTQLSIQCLRCHVQNKKAAKAQKQKVTPTPTPLFTRPFYRT